MNTILNYFMHINFHSLKKLNVLKISISFDCNTERESHNSKAEAAHDLFSGLKTKGFV